VKLWDATSGQEGRTLSGHSDAVTGVAFSPDGHRLASASGDQTVKLWNTATGQEVLTLSFDAVMVSGVAFSPDGRRLAASYSRDFSRGEVKVWDGSPLEEGTPPGEGP
jgi:WD40 repeat protein